MPRAFMAEGLRLPKIDMSPIEDMMVALMAEAGNPDKTRYASITPTVATTVHQRGALSEFMAASTIPATIARWAHETATRWVKPHVWNARYSSDPLMS